MLRCLEIVIILLSLVDIIKTQELPKLPETCNLITEMPDLSKYKIITVGNPGKDYTDLQQALLNADYGTILELEAGVIFKGSYYLPKKVGEGWIIIKSSHENKLPGIHQRISPNHKIDMPTIMTINTAGLPAIYTEHGAHHYRFIGVEITVAVAVKNSYGLVQLGNGYNSSPQINVDQIPNQIIFDRCYIHGHDEADIMKFGLRMDGANLAIIDSYVSQFHSIGYDAQAVGGFNGPGPFKIINNYLEASGENVFFGGATATIKNVVPSDIEIKHNTLSKPVEWRISHPDYKGKHWTIKNLFELKTGRRVLFDGNILENSWADLPIGQSGYAILLTVRNEDGTNPQSDISDISITNNIIRHCAAGISISGHDDNKFPSHQSKRIRIYNNIFEDIDGTKYGDGNIYGPNDGVFLKIGDPDDIVVEHNTVIQSGAVTWMYDTTLNARCTDNIFNGNITKGGYQGMYGGGFARGGDKPMAAYLPGINDQNQKFNRNILIGELAEHYQNYATKSKNYFPKQFSDVGFINFSNAANDFHDYALSNNSQYSGKQIGGKDPGVQIVELNNALEKIQYDCTINKSKNQINKLNFVYYSSLYNSLHFGNNVQSFTQYDLYNVQGKNVESGFLTVEQDKIILTKKYVGLFVLSLRSSSTFYCQKIILE